MSIAVCSQDESHVIATFRGHVLVYWDGTPTLKATKGLYDTVIPLARKHPKRVAVIQVVSPAPGFPSAEIRQGFVRAGRDCNNTLGCGSIHVQGQGFPASALRALIAGLLLAIRPAFPIQVFSSLSESVDFALFHLQQVGETLGSRSEVIDALDWLEHHGRTPK